jgi:hypothetical protein
MLRHLIIAFALTLTTLAPAHADELTERLKFWDDGPQDASFVKFRNKLKATIASKNASALFEILASDIKIDFGGFGGGPEFHKMWKPYDKDSKVWAALSLVIEQGGNFDSPVQFSAPYVFSAFPSDVDVEDKLVVTNEDAVLREQPKADAKIVRKLDRDILTLVSLVDRGSVTAGSYIAQHEAHADTWYAVKDAKGQQGFVPARDVRSPIDYRAYFEKHKGKWVMTMFLAGD